MTFSNGHDGYFVYSLETTPGTRVVPAIALPFIQESMRDQGSQPLPNQGIIKGRRMMHGAQRTKADIRGQVRFPLIADGIGSFLKAAFGAVSTTGVGPYVHVLTRRYPLPSLSAQIGWEDIAGTDFRKDYIGGLVDGWTLNVAANQNPDIQFDLTARSEQRDAYPAIVPTFGTLSYFEFSDATVAIDGGATICFDTVSLQGRNNLQPSRAICPSNPRSTVYEDAGSTEVTGTIGRDFDAWTYYDKFVAGTEATIQIILTAGAAAKLQFDLNVRFTGETPQVPGQERIKQGIPFTVLSAVDDPTACKATLTNSDATI